MKTQYLLGVGACLLSVTFPAQAQQGVSPSGSALWLDGWDPRFRENGKATERKVEQIADPHFLKMSLAGALRMQGNLTGYHSQYDQAPLALNDDDESSTGTSPLIATLQQTVEWNRIQFAGSKHESFLSTTDLSAWLQVGTLDSGRLTLDANGGVTIASADDFQLSLADGAATWFMQPGSSLRYEKQWGDVVFVAYDQFTARPDAALSFLGLLQGTAMAPFFATLQNDLGTALYWQPVNKLRLSLNYNWATSEAMRSSNQGMAANSYGNLDVLADRDIHSLLATVEWEACSAARLGLRGGHAWTSYTQSFSNDGQQWHAGLFADFCLPAKQRLHLDAGFQGMSFDAARPLGILLPSFPFVPSSPAGYVTTHADTSDLKTTPYASFSLSGPLGNNLQHQLMAGQEAALGLLSNYVEAHFLNYRVQAHPWKHATLGVSAFYEKLQDSGGVFASDSEVHGGSIDLQQRWRKWTFSAGYAHTHFTTDAQPSSLVRISSAVRQNAFQTGVSWQMTASSALSLSWQRIDSQIEGGIDHAVQDRLMVSLKMPF